MTNLPRKVESKERSTATLSPPWVMDGQHRISCSTQAEFDKFIDRRSEVHVLYIRESQRTRRLGMCLAAALLALGCLIPLFAPEGREVLSYWLSAGLFVFAAGAMGYSTIRYKSDKENLELSKADPGA